MDQSPPLQQDLQLFFLSGEAILMSSFSDILTLQATIRHCRLLCRSPARTTFYKLLCLALIKFACELKHSHVYALFLCANKELLTLAYYEIIYTTIATQRVLVGIRE